jgi:hypothetical protein
MIGVSTRIFGQITLTYIKATKRNPVLSPNNFQADEINA